MFCIRLIKIDYDIFWETCIKLRTAKLKVILKMIQQNLLYENIVVWIYAVLTEICL